MPKRDSQIQARPIKLFLGFRAPQFASHEPYQASLWADDRHIGFSAHVLWPDSGRDEVGDHLYRRFPDGGAEESFGGTVVEVCGTAGSVRAHFSRWCSILPPFEVWVPDLSQAHHVLRLLRPLRPVYDISTLCRVYSGDYSALSRSAAALAESQVGSDVRAESIVCMNLFKSIISHRNSYEERTV